MNDSNSTRDQWWLASLGTTLVWARLRVRHAGTAEVLDSDGNTLSYDSEDTARAQLFDADVNGRRIWRLRIGPVDETTAPELAARIVGLGFGQPQRVRE